MVRGWSFPKIQMQPMPLCFLSCRRFEDTFKNAHWRKVKQMQSMRLCFLSCRRFEDNVYFLICCNSVQNLVIGCCLLHWFQSWLPGWVTYITTLPCNALLTLSVSIGLVSLSVRVISVKFAQPLLLTYLETDIGTHRSDPRTHGSDKKGSQDWCRSQSHQESKSWDIPIFQSKSWQS